MQLVVYWSDVVFDGDARRLSARCTTWSEFLVEWRDADGAARREPVRDVGRVPFEAALPVRSFSSYRGHRNWPRLWWSATMTAHVGYESWLERDLTRPTGAGSAVSAGARF